MLITVFCTNGYANPLNRFEEFMGITVTCLKWNCRYLSNQKGYAVLDRFSSSSQDLICGIPQRSAMELNLYDTSIFHLVNIIFLPFYWNINNSLLYTTCVCFKQKIDLNSNLDNIDVNPETGMCGWVPTLYYGQC